MRSRTWVGKLSFGSAAAGEFRPGCAVARVGEKTSSCAVSQNRASLADSLFRSHAIARVRNYSAQEYHRAQMDATRHSGYAGMNVLEVKKL